MHWLGEQRSVPKRESIWLWFTMETLQNQLENRDKRTFKRKVMTRKPAFWKTHKEISPTDRKVSEISTVIRINATEQQAQKINFVDKPVR